MMRRARRGVLGLVLAVAGLGPASGVRAAEDRNPVFKTSLDMVYLSLIVTDSEGRFVTRLEPGDFTILEDGQPQRIELFARALEPGQDELLSLDLGMLFDTSQSMLKQLRLSQEAAARFLESIPRARDLLTIFFDQDIRISRYDSENQQGLFERIWAAKGGGNTALYDSIAVYLSRVQESHGRKVLVLFTDGEDSTSTLTLGETMRMLKASPVTVYAVAFRGDFQPGSMRALASSAALHEMASLTGGAVFTPMSSKNLSEIYSSILKDLESQYVVGYVPSARDDGRYHRLKVSVKQRELKVRHRDGYQVPGSQLASSPRSSP